MTWPSALASDGPVFVGRQRELASLQERLDEALDGRGGLVMLTGEAGVGKTWLARELTRRAAWLDCRVLDGSSFEGDWQPPYGAWVEALGDFVRTSETAWLCRTLGPGATALTQLLPALRARLPDLPSPPPLSPDEERFRLYDAVGQFLLTASRESPLLLVLDDLHWADQGTLRLLRHLARFAGRARLLILGLYRDQELELAQPHPLADLLAVLRRETDYYQVAVRGFSYDETAEYLAQAAGLALPQALARAIYAEAGGNPFYVREVLRHLIEEEKILRRDGRWSTDLSIGELGIPEGVRRVVSRRLSRLSEPTSNLLRLAAGFSGGFEFPVLQALAEMPEEALLDAVDDALRAGLLRVSRDAPATYDFAHAIVRHAIYDELNPDRRARLHRRIAAALERAYAGDELAHAAELAAQHHASAGQPGSERGVPYALAAAEQARGGSAPEQAVVYLRMARDLVAAGDRRRAEVLGRLAVAEAEALLFAEARESLDEALAAIDVAGYEPRDRIDARVELLTAVARALKEGGAPATAWQPLLERGLMLLGDRRDLLWARLTLLRDNFETLANGPITVVRWLGPDPEAVAVARASGDEDDYARTLDPLDWRSREETEAVLARARTWRRPAAIMRALDVVARDLLKRHGAHREAAERYRELLDLGGRYGSIPSQAEALMQLAIIEVALGELSRARQTARRAQETIERLGPAHGLRFGITALESLLSYFLDGDWPALARTAGEFARGQRTPNPRALVAGAYAALAFARAGDPDEVRRLLGSLTPVLVKLEPTLYVHHAAITFGGSAIWEIGAADLAAPYRDLALGLLDAGFADSILLPELTVARMAALLGRLDVARDAFAVARRKAQSNGTRTLLPIIDYDEALALFRAGETSRLSSLAAAALAEFEALGMDGWAKRALALRESLPARPAALAPSDGERPSGLTAREVEVLRLLASGQTNREIAAALSISLPTAERHVANIYAKIGARGRVEATAFALGQGIVRLREP